MGEETRGRGGRRKTSKGWAREPGTDGQEKGNREGLSAGRVRDGQGREGQGKAGEREEKGDKKRRAKDTDEERRMSDAHQCGCRKGRGIRDDRQRHVEKGRRRIDR